LAEYARFLNKYVCQKQSATSQDKKTKIFNIFLRYLLLMKENIRKILREYTEKRLNHDFMRKVDYAQEKAIESSDYPVETEKISDMVGKIKKKVKKAYIKVTGKEPVSSDNIIVKVDDNIKAGKIASFKHPKNKKDLGLMKIHPKALNDLDYIENIIKHELDHAGHGLEDNMARNHKGVFQDVADEIGLSKEYRH
jgi:hypothetical protein